MDNFSNTDAIANWENDTDTLEEEEEFEEEEELEPIVIKAKVDLKRLNTEIYFKLSQLLEKMKLKYDVEPTKSTYDNIILLEEIK